MKPVKTPNLPEGRVSLVLLGSGAGENIRVALEKLGVEVLMIPECGDIPKPVSSHPDMLCHHLGGENVVVCRNIADIIGPGLEKYGFRVTLGSDLLKPVYPFDAALDAARVGKRLFCRQAAVDKTIAAWCAQAGVEIVNVRQGYAKCSVCVVDENSIITADESIAKAAVSRGINTLLIRRGHISLSGYDYGFIGGCSGKLAPDKICFSGCVELHPDFGKIQSFLHNHGVENISLGGGSLCDIGGIIPLAEE